MNICDKNYSPRQKNLNLYFALIIQNLIVLLFEDLESREFSWRGKECPTVTWVTLLS